MQETAKNQLNEALADAVMDRPREFFIGKQRFEQWSPSLGMSLMLERHLSALGIDSELLVKNPSMEAMRLVSSKRIECCRILAILSTRERRHFDRSKWVERRARFFSRSLSDEDIAQLLLLSMSEPKAETLISLSGVAKEQEEQARIVKHKNKDGHTLSFGGKTIFGSLIIPACETLKCLPSDVVWGMSLTQLQMSLADKINTVYLSDEDMKSLGISSTQKQKFGMTPEDIAKLKAMDWS